MNHIYIWRIGDHTLLVSNCEATERNDGNREALVSESETKSMERGADSAIPAITFII